MTAKEELAELRGRITALENTIGRITSAPVPANGNAQAPKPGRWLDHCKYEPKKQGSKCATSRCGHAIAVGDRVWYAGGQIFCEPCGNAMQPVKP